MPRTILGKVSLTPKGEYSPDTAYTALDVVSYEGSSWLALQDVTGVAPVEGENWMLLAQKGDQGEQGIQGIQGIQGETGGPGPTGPQGASFTRLEKTAGTGAPGTIDTYTAYNSEGEEVGNIKVYNGMDGTGAGDFKADGTVPMTGDLQMAQHRVTGLADATEDGDAVNKGQMDAGLAERADLTLSNLSNRQKALRNIGGRPNRNLLDNWYFVGGGSQQGGGQFPINQRGFTSAGASNTRTFDRWGIYLYINGTVSLDPDGISISGTLDFGSPIENSRVPKIPGLVITISALNANGQLVTKTVPLLNNGTTQYVVESLNWGGDGNLAYIRNWNNLDTDLFYFNLLGYTGPKIVAAKLELGPIQTLAYQDEDGNWQLFETPDYAEELAKCQRYYEQTYWSVFYAVANSASQIDCAGSLVFSVQKRIAPTSTVNPNPLQNLSVQDASNGFTPVSGCALQIPTAYNRNMIAPRVTGNFTIGHIYRITVPDNAYIISAEL